jgi:glycosyltransferase involved in cell wall biosynthesis
VGQELRRLLLDAASAAVVRPAANMTARPLVVIPAFNESALIAAVVTRVRHALPDADVLVVDDGSRDATAELARSAGARVVSHPFNLGYGAALQTGYFWGVRRGYPAVVQMDADGQHDPADVPRLLAPVLDGRADIVIGSRFVEDSGYAMGVRTAGRVFLRALLRALGGPNVTDPTSGFQALRREVIQFCCAEFYPSDFPDIDVLLTLHRHGFRVLEVPVVMAASPPGRRSMHAGLRDVYYTYKMMLSTIRSRLGRRVARPSAHGEEAW